jgi:hypothetical protein
VVGAVRCAAVAAVGGSVALIVLSFWGPSVDYFYQQAYFFGGLSLSLAVLAMVVTALRLPPTTVSFSGLSGVVLMTLLVAIPGAFAFVWLPRVSDWFWVASISLGAAIASLLFPRGRRRWVPLLWLACAGLAAASIPVSRFLTDSEANVSEGIGMFVVQVLVWAAVLVAAAIVSARVRPKEGTEELARHAEQALQPDAPLSAPDWQS